MSVFPTSRVHDILRRIQEHSAQSDATKTCFGILAILSREDVNKMVIAREGLDIILSSMTTHIDKSDVQEAGCDLLWSLAFNSAPIKEIIAKFNGASVLVRALKRHGKSSDYMKSACGALSNMCQSKLNQEAVASYGGLQPLVGSIHTHQLNHKLLPFIFDAVASLIVSNEENARTVSSLGVIPLIISSLGRHRTIAEVVKSGCHALAILSDVKGQASKIAFAGGVPGILTLLDLHPSYSDLHRVAAVVLLRMLQESAHVARELVCHEGIRILFKSLESGGARQDTVAAVTHILFAVTSSSSQNPNGVEPQLWLPPDVTQVDSQQNKSNLLKNGKRKPNNKQSLGSSSRVVQGDDGSFRTSTGMAARGNTALKGLVSVLKQYINRRDVARAACRLLNNLCDFNGVLEAVDSHGVFDSIMECVGTHGDSRDVTESATCILKVMNSRSPFTLKADNSKCVRGMLDLLLAKMDDDDIVSAICGGLSRIVMQRSARRGTSTEKPTGDDEQNNTESSNVNTDVVSGDELFVDLYSTHFECKSLHTIAKVIAYVVTGTLPDLGADAGANEPRRGTRQAPKRAYSWSKQSQTSMGDLLSVYEMVLNANFLSADDFEEHCDSLRSLGEFVHNRSVDLGRRINKILNRHKSSNEPANKSKHSDVNEGEEDQTKCTPVTDGESEISTSSSNSKSSSKSNVSRSDSITTETGGPVPAGVTGRLRENWPNHLERMLASQPPPLASFAPIDGGPNSTPSDRMHIVYESRTAAGKDILSRVTTPVPYVVPSNGLGQKFEHSLTFDSEFESGNLLRAVQRGDAAYDLFLRSDMHTVGHTQWFYFACSNTHPASLVRLAEQGVQVPPVRVRFNIINFTKPDSLFNMGMRPVLYSVNDASSRGTGWVRAGTDISYYCSPYPRTNTAGEGLNYYYMLSFTMEFHNANDQYMMAYCYPYTYTDYRAHINSILSRPGAQDKIRKSTLCKTLSGVSCDLITITDFSDSDRIGPYSPSIIDTPSTDSKRTKGQRNFKPAIFFSARVHPGETPASWMMKGMLDYLTSESNQARILRNVFVIFIVPMLNPDGVIYGNNRCSLAGVDLNRQWKTPTRNTHPTVWHLKAFMGAQTRVREVYMYIDLHGHSRKHNVFMYGCDDKRRPRPQVRAFPRFLSLHSVGKKYVSYSDCSFHVRKGRESTARVVVAKEINIPLSFTLESTFCGISYGPLKHCHINIGHLQEVGGALCDAVLNFSMSEGFMKDVPTAVAMLPTPGSGGNGGGRNGQGGVAWTVDPKKPAIPDVDNSMTSEDGKVAEDVDSGSDEGSVASELPAKERSNSISGISNSSVGSGRSGRGRRQNRGGVERIESKSSTSSVRDRDRRAKKLSSTTGSIARVNLDSEEMLKTRHAGTHGSADDSNIGRGKLFIGQAGRRASKAAASAAAVSEDNGQGNISPNIIQSNNATDSVRNSVDSINKNFTGFAPLKNNLPKKASSSDTMSNALEREGSEVDQTQTAFTKALSQRHSPTGRDRAMQDEYRGMIANATAKLNRSPDSNVDIGGNNDTDDLTDKRFGSKSDFLIGSRTLPSPSASASTNSTSPPGVGSPPRPTQGGEKNLKLNLNGTSFTSNSSPDIVGLATKNESGSRENGKE